MFRSRLPKEENVVRYLEALDRAIVRQNGTDAPVAMGEGSLRIEVSASPVEDRRRDKEAQVARLALHRRERRETVWTLVRQIELGDWAVDAC